VTARLGRLRDVCIDANDVDRVAGFWAAVLGRTPEPGAGGNVLLEPANGDVLRIWVNPVPEPKSAKTRVHVDVTLDAARADDPVGPLLDLGATVVREPVEGQPWWILTDPEGTEFCAFPRDAYAS